MNFEKIGWVIFFILITTVIPMILLPNNMNSEGPMGFFMGATIGIPLMLSGNDGDGKGLTIMGVAIILAWIAKILWLNTVFPNFWI